MGVLAGRSSVRAAEEGLVILSGACDMAQVVCEVSPGLRPTERTVAVQDVRGPRQFLRFEEEFLIQEGDRTFLPVGVVGVDEERRVALIELPHEADSGANRVWVR